MNLSLELNYQLPGERENLNGKLFQMSSLFFFQDSFQFYKRDSMYTRALTQSDLFRFTSLKILETEPYPPI